MAPWPYTEQTANCRGSISCELTESAAGSGATTKRARKIGNFYFLPNDSSVSVSVWSQPRQDDWSFASRITLTMSSLLKKKSQSEGSLLLSLGGASSGITFSIEVSSF